MSGKGEVVARARLCFLEVPANKTSANFVKPVDAVVGEAIAAWERVRPASPVAIDRITGERVSYLFTYRLIRLGRAFINATLIPLLCNKAGVANHASLGPITSHRARATIATQLATAETPMSVLDVKDWLGHKEVRSTLRYLHRPHEKLAESYRAAEVLSNVRRLNTLTGAPTEMKSQPASSKLLRIKDYLTQVRQTLNLSADQSAVLAENQQLLEDVLAILSP